MVSLDDQDSDIDFPLMGVLKRLTITDINYSHIYTIANKLGIKLSYHYSKRSATQSPKASKLSLNPLKWFSMKSSQVSSVDGNNNPAAVATDNGISANELASNITNNREVNKDMVKGSDNQIDLDVPLFQLHVKFEIRGSNQGSWSYTTSKISQCIVNQFNKSSDSNDGTDVRYLVNCHV